MNKSFGFKIAHGLGDGTLARTGVISTPHGPIKTPAFVVVGTQATVKAMTPEMVREAGGQAVLANAYHLYLRPGHKLVEKAGGLAKFMHWEGPTFTDSAVFRCSAWGAAIRKYCPCRVAKYRSRKPWPSRVSATPSWTMTV